MVNEADRQPPRLVYLLREYAFLAVVLGGDCGFSDQVYLGRISWIWGAVTTSSPASRRRGGSHRLATLTNEESPYMFVRNRLLNEFHLPKWFLHCSTLLGTTHRLSVPHLGT